MTSDQIRQSFFDFFKEREHAILPSASLMPTAPNLLFTNAGMNPFVPYFLGDRKAPWKRAADTQKCIRAGGKHNDLDDVGLDTYHQTFFEMLGNWSFGDYFKEEAIEWGWDLLTKVWKFPKERLYVTVYKPGEGDPADFDAEAYAIWERILKADGLDPKERILFGGKKDNFWMMGETGPCGPCSEIHIDLTEKGDTGGKLVNADDPFCIEIWNLVFIQFNAEEDGGFRPLKNRHVDTGMGLERVAGILATTDNFSDFSRPPSNYNSDLFTPIFEKITAMSGLEYGASLPANPKKLSEAEMRDVAFRVLGDHIRTLCCSIADGILPGNEGRNYVLRRILRRAVLFGRRLNLKPGFFTQLADPLITRMEGIFPELREQQTVIRKVLASEEAAFDRTIDRGIQLLERIFEGKPSQISGEEAFELYDTYGFPLDLTEILAHERGLKVDNAGFEKAMEAQRERARAAQQKTVIRVSEGQAGGEATAFVGFEPERLSDHACTLLEVVDHGGKAFALLDSSPFYAEMGGQVGDTGTLQQDSVKVAITDTIKDESGQFLHQLGEGGEQLVPGETAQVSVDRPRRHAIQCHHSATHLLHWALRSVLGAHVRQAGSLVDPDRLRFDFSHFEALTAAQIEQIEGMVNARIQENAAVQWYEVPFDQKPEDVIAFFGEKYGDTVRVVDIGGYSRELCGGTHVQATGEIGFFKLTSESAIAAGTRRIEAVAGPAALRWAKQRFSIVEQLAQNLSARPDELLQRIDDLNQRLRSSERELKSLKGAQSSAKAGEILDQSVDKNGLQVLACKLEASNPNELKTLATKIFAKMDKGLLVVGAAIQDKATLIAMASPEAIADGFKAGDIIRELTARLDGRGGGKPDFAMGGGSRTDSIDSVLKGWLNAL
ncbi:MAG: alanine--tRNA ligase [Opitutales bacterium]|nr:alanine--tRNA ligase [Opitutales bacterium]